MRPPLHDFKPGDLIDYLGYRGKTQRGIVDEETTDIRVWLRFPGEEKPGFTTRYTDIILIERNAYDLEPLDD